MKHFDVAVAIVFSDSKILIARRKSGGTLGGLWEFPGGKREPDETLEQCVRRELLEELAMRVHPVVCFAPIQYQYPDRLVSLHPFLCTHESGEPKLLACDEIHWVEPTQLRSFEFPPANRELIDQVIAAFPTPPGPVSVTLRKRKKPARHAMPAPVTA